MDYVPRALFFYIMDRETLIGALKGKSAATFLEDHLFFDSVPHVFGGDRGHTWLETGAWGGHRRGSSLPHVGGTAVGCTMNPGKNLKPFND